MKKQREQGTNLVELSVYGEPETLYLRKKVTENWEMAKPVADSHSNRAAVQATNDDASASKLCAWNLSSVFLLDCIEF